MKGSIVSLVLFLCIFSVAVGQHATANKKQVKKLNVAAIEQALNMKGQEKEGEYKITVPQHDLQVEVDDFKIIPPMGMGSWVAFNPTPKGAMLMGDIVLKGEEIGPVQQVVVKNGLTITGLHNHFVREKPDVMYMHIGGNGTEESLAKGVKAVLDKVTELRGGDPGKAAAQKVENSLDVQKIASILGHAGDMNSGVYKITIGRPDVNLQEHGQKVSAFMGFNTWASWQGTPERAAVAGDFAMLENEVEPVIKALVENGIEVVAVHNHMVHEEPRIFFLHYWGVGPADKLAAGLKAALDQTGKSQSKTGKSH